MVKTKLFEVLAARGHKQRWLLAELERRGHHFSETYLSQVKSGAKSPSRRFMRAVSETLNMPKGELFDAGSHHNWDTYSHHAPVASYIHCKSWSRSISRNDGARPSGCRHPSSGHFICNVQRSAQSRRRPLCRAAIHRLLACNNPTANRLTSSSRTASIHSILVGQLRR